MKRCSLIKCILTVASIGGCLATADVRSHAQTVTLSSLLVPGHKLVCGDKVFDLFGYLKTGDMPNANAVNVSCRLISPSVIGLRFQGGFQDFAGGGASDALITYRVTSHGTPIHGVRLDGNPSVVGGTGAMQVDETFLPAMPATNLSIFQLRPGTSQYSDSAFFAPVHSLRVQKDILGFARTGYASESFVDQDYYQTTTVPEGSSLLMLLPALVPLVIFVRKRRTRQPA